MPSVAVARPVDGRLLVRRLRRTAAKEASETADREEAAPQNLRLRGQPRASRRGRLVQSMRRTTSSGGKAHRGAKNRRSEAPSPSTTATRTADHSATDAPETT